MKKIICLLGSLILCVILCAQSPNQLSYQAVLHDNDNAPLDNQDISLMISVIQGSADGTVVYSESYTVTTNAYGLASLEIGMGQIVSGDFSDIQWGTNSFYIQTSIDLEGGDNYSLVGTTMCQSVPYAFYANSAETITGTISSSQITGVVQPDTITGTIMASQINGYIAADTLLGTISASQVIGISDPDTITGTIMGSQITGYITADTLLGTISASQVIGISDPDTITGTIMASQVIGITDPDTITGTIAASQITGLTQVSSSNGVINALHYGIAGDGVTNDTEAINALLDSVDGERVFFPAGIYNIDSLHCDAENINIDGIYPMYIDSCLKNGTVFRGKLSFTGTNVRITNLGVDLSGLEADDGLRVTPEKNGNDNVGKFCDIHNIITVGANKTSTYHSFLIEGFDQVNISNIEVRDAYMGIVLKVEGGTLNNLRAFEIEKESLFIKSDNVFGYCMDLIIDKVYIENTSAPLSQGIRILSSGAQLENINLSNIFIRRTLIGLAIVSAGHNGVMTNNINVNNVKIDYPSLHGIYLEANKGSVDNINMSNVDVTHATNILTTLGNINYLNITDMNANILSSTSSEEKKEIIKIGANTVGTNFSNITILNGHIEDPDLAILYNNDGNQNRISNYNIRLRGGMPTSGQSTIDLEFANNGSNEIQPLFNNINNLSIVTVVPNAEDTEINSISLYPDPVYTSDKFQLGYELLIHNNSDFHITIKNNPSGNIENPEDQDISIPPHTFVTYVFSGSLWDKEE